MKSASLFLVSILIFLFTAPSFSASIVAADDDLVLDFFGNPLERNAGYLLSLTGRGAASGMVSLTPPIRNNGTCDADVVLVRPALSPIDGTPFAFTSVNASVDAIRVRSPLAIGSPTRNPCGDSTIWKISSREGFLTPIITTGGTGNTMASCFRIIKTQQQFSATTLYALQHCRGTCGPTREAPRCSPVGTTRSESGEHLSVGGSSPLWFYFLKLTEPTVKQDVASF